MGAAPILSIFKNGEKISESSIEGEGVLGRAEGCVVRLEDRAISRQHVILRPIESGLQIERKSEFAPLSVNGNEVTRALLKENDVVMIGPFMVRVSYPKPEPVIEPAPPVVEAPPEPEPPSAIGQTPLDLSNANTSITDGPSLQMQTNLIQAAPEGGVGIALGSPESAAPAQLEGIEAMMAAEMEGNSQKTNVIAQPDVVVRIVVAPSSSEPVEYEMTADEVYIGRTRECQIVIKDKKCSRRHAKIAKAGLRFVLTDMDTVNGTYLNGARVQQQELTGDDMIQIGDTEIKFQVISANQGVVQEIHTTPGEATSLQSAMDQGGNSGDGAPSELAIDPAILGAAMASAEVPPANASQPMQSPMQVGDPAQFGMLPGSPQGQTQAPAPAKKKSLVLWFRAQPKQRQVILGVLFMAFMALLMLDFPNENGKAPKGQTGAPGQAQTPGQGTFDKLPSDKKRFVEAQYTLSVDLFKNKDFDKSLFELRQIFALVPDYKDARTIERMAMEGKRLQELASEERKKKEEAEKVKAQVALLLEQAQQRMNEKKFTEAQQVFNDVLALDPENPQVAKWKAEIEEENARKQVQTENQNRLKAASNDAWKVFNRAKKLQEEEKLYPAIGEFQRAIELGKHNRKLVSSARARIADIRQSIRTKIAPLLEEGKKEEEANNHSAAYKLYKKASVLDPYSKEAASGMSRVREALHIQAKQIYTEGVIAESYSDFDSAQKKFKEILAVSPEEDIYYDRAQSKLKRYQPYGKLQELQ